jgi:hypothetical protein
MVYLFYFPLSAQMLLFEATGAEVHSFPWSGWAESVCQGTVSFFHTTKQAWDPFFLYKV